MSGESAGTRRRRKAWRISSMASWWRGVDRVRTRPLRRAVRMMAVVTTLAAAGAGAAGVIVAVTPGGRCPAEVRVVLPAPAKGTRAGAQSSVPDGPAPAVRALANKDRDPAPVEPGPALAAADPPPSGRELFAREWLPHDPRCHDGDGLGPVYNETSCLACHGQGAPGGGGPEEKNVEILTMNRGTIQRLGRTGRDLVLTRTPGLYDQNSVLDLSETRVDSLVSTCPREAIPVDGLVLSAGGSDLSGKLFRIHSDQAGRELVATSEEGEIRGELFTVRPDDVALTKVHPGLRHATSVVFHRYGVDPRYQRWRSDLSARVPTDSSMELTGARVTRSRRNPPPLFGAGLIDALPDQVFVEAAAQQPDKTRGRVSRMEDGRIGRFGWKAQVASLNEFVLSACANELGLEVPGHHQPPSPFEPDAVATSLDLTKSECDALTAYVRDLPAPITLAPSNPSGSRAVDEGRRLFMYVGCTVCHTPNLGPIEGMYSDMLLHDIGLDDGAVYYGSDNESPGAAKSSEWRTAPLWGVRDSAPYLHDGRARTLVEAVALHGGQAADSAKAFDALPEKEKRQLLAFLCSLSAPVGPDEVGRRQADTDLGASPEQLRTSFDAQAAGAARSRLAAGAVARSAAGQQQRGAFLGHTLAGRRRAAAARPAWQRHLQIDTEDADQQARPELAKSAHLAATLHSAQALEKMGKVPAALGFYNALLREAPDSEEARAAAERIRALSP